MKVIVGGLIRDRLPQLEAYLRHLHTLWSPGEIVWTFVLDNCSAAATALVLGTFPTAQMITVDDGGPEYHRDGGPKPYKRMARLRNLLRGAALREGFDGLLSVDSDIVVPPDLLARLVAADQPWVSAIVDNSRGSRSAFNAMPLIPGGTFRVKHAKPDLVHGGRAGVIGAVCYYRRDLLERVSFANDQNVAEDAAFAKAAHGLGFEGRYIPLECEHLMTDAQVSAHRAHCSLCALVPVS